ncbi:MAG: response regulator [Bdellovibrionota bacterium]|nr:MAG: response regulator [Bdellovibrionota bacterium]
MTCILLIDDSAEIRTLVGDLLTGSTYQYCAVSSPEEAHAICAQVKVDLILCDLVLRMQAEDGQIDELNVSAMVGLRAISEFAARRPECPVVAMSGALTGEPLKAVERFGATGTLSKPFSRRQLLDVIDQALAA